MFWDRMREDLQAVFDNDPAVKNYLEAVLTYPGVHALWMHRFAHRLYGRGLFTSARLISHFGRFVTGIEIHPGATIGHKVFIDHGMGVVIGETAEIGDECLLYKGVVLGGTSLEKKKRHPTLGRCVVVGSNACILGAIDIGDGARIGSGSVVVKPVPPGATVVGVPGKIVKKRAEAGPSGDVLRDKLAHADLPDPLINVLAAWMKLLERYEEKLNRLEGEHGFPPSDLARAFREELHRMSLDEVDQAPEPPPATATCPDRVEE
jgi:serine O-acetyltransferase